MEDNVETPTDKKSVNKTKSGPSMKIKNELASKRKSFNVNDAVRSLDLTLGRLKKSKLVDGEYTSNTAHTSPVRHSFASSHMFVDSLTEPNYIHGIDNGSVMSMNFSHYELMRNLSRSNCNSEGAFSSTTCNAYMNASDLVSKNEHLERYFRSAETWSRNCTTSSTSAAQFEIPDK